MTSKDGEQLPKAFDSAGLTNNMAPRVHEPAPTKHKSISCTQCRKRKLKCDRGKPSCSTCARLQHQCIYPEGRVKSTARRRNVKDLEARLAQVETLLSSEVASKLASRELPTGNRKSESNSETGIGNYWDDLEIDMIMANDIHGSTDQASSSLPLLPSIENPFLPQELIGFGLEENLPSQEVIDELHHIYFTTVHITAPTLQKYRYLANVHLLPPLGPPVCLRYAVWANAASCSEKYSSHQDVFYRRARKYAELDEMKGHGEHYATVSHAQCWSLLSNYEAQTMYLSRAWVSAGRCIRLVQMMNLHKLDSGGTDAKQIIAPARDWTELEERRRTFWAAFCCDRYSCVGTGWPMTIDERDITTHLPASEEAFELGQAEVTITLSEAMTPAGAARVSPYAGVVLMACLYGHNWLHLHRPGLKDHPEDVVDGEFWKRHRKMDNVLSNTFMFLPERLRLPAGLNDPNVIYINMNIHASTICLHQAAVLKAEKHGLDTRIIRQSQARCRVAAQEIVNIMRLISHTNIAEMNAWVAFNLYIATGVLIEGCRSPETSQESRSNLDFLITALQAIGRKHVITQTFLAQLQIDLETAGLSSPFGEVNKQKSVFGDMGPSSIDVRNFKNRVEEFSSDVLNKPLFPLAILPIVNGSSESCSTSDKDSAAPPQDPHEPADFCGVLPKQDIAERLRRATQYGPCNFKNHPENNTTSDLSDLFNIPGGLPRRHNVRKKQGYELLPNQVDTAYDSTEGQQPSYSPIFTGQQKSMQQGSKGTIIEQNLGALNTGAAINGMLPDWALGPVDNSQLTGFSGFDFPPLEGQDMNSLLNGAPWDGSTL